MNMKFFYLFFARNEERKPEGKELDENTTNKNEAYI